MASLPTRAADRILQVSEQLVSHATPQQQHSSSPDTKNGVDATATRRADVDCLIIGAGFGGCYQLHLLRKAGFVTKLVDAASQIGGVWAWNRYPGARVDIEMPYYGFTAPEIWSTWTWDERYPGGEQILRYFEHVDRIWGLSKDIELGVKITSVEMESCSDGPRWNCISFAGHVYRARFLICATGAVFKPYTPEFQDIGKFKGIVEHSSLWPADGIKLAGKRVAIVGAGATAIQVVQEAAKVASKVTQFIRTPSYAMPMHQRSVSRAEIYAYKPAFHHAIKACRNSRNGLPQMMSGLRTFEVSENERLALWEEWWERGALNWSTSGFVDTVTSKKANRAAYDFWVSKTRHRIKNPQKRDLLVPLEPPYWIATKRMPLEQDYYEMCDQDHVDITNSPITHFTESGIATKDRVEDFDVVAMCTGYDAVTGGLINMNIRGEGGLYLRDKWASGVSTFLGMTIHGFPNMFILYGPQAPFALSNGPPFLELQCEWVRDALVAMNDEGKTTISAKRHKEDEWRQHVHKLAHRTLFTDTDSWYIGANVPGKNRELLTYVGGIPIWHDQCRAALKDWNGFDVS